MKSTQTLYMNGLLRLSVASYATFGQLVIAASCVFQGQVSSHRRTRTQRNNRIMDKVMTRHICHKTYWTPQPPPCPQGYTRAGSDAS